MLQKAMRACPGPIDDLVEGLIYENPYIRMTKDAFVFDTPGGARFRYDRGSVVKLENPTDALDAECRLYQWGTVYGAVAWMTGMVPLHASCVTDGDRSVAFTAQSGVGKSTLAAALVRSGWQSVCDDTLVLAKCGEGFFALPDENPAKLSDETALALELETGDVVPHSPGKFYVELPKVAAKPLPIRDLVMLEDGPRWKLTPIAGADKLELIGSSLYRGFVHSALHSVEEHAQLMFQLASGLNCWRMTCPRVRNRLADMAVTAAELLDGLGH